MQGFIMPEQPTSDDHKTETHPSDQHSGREAASEDQIPAELLKSFEKNYYSRRRISFMVYTVSALIAIALLTAVVWFQTTSTPVQTSKTSKPAVQLSQAFRPSSSTGKTPLPPTKPAAVVQKAVSAARTTAAVTPRKLPTFIPAAGRDSNYSRLNPGWERYIGPNHEFRIFKSGSSIKVVQVLGTRQHTINDVFLKSVLSELLGGSDYSVTSREQKEGFVIVRGNVSHRGEIVIYTKKSRMLAFVVSIT
jgi:hypothetical protein